MLAAEETIKKAEGNKYRREWRQRNKEKVKQYRVRMWNKKAGIKDDEKEPSGMTPEARAEYNAYFRKWKKENCEKVKAYRERSKKRKEIEKLAPIVKQSYTNEGAKK